MWNSSGAASKEGLLLRVGEESIVDGVKRRLNFSKIGLINTFLTRKQDYCLVKFTRKQGYCLVKFTRKQDYLGCKDTKNIVSCKIMSHYFARNGVKTLFRAE